MSGYNQNSMIIQMPAVVGSSANLGGPFSLSSMGGFTNGLATISGLTSETINFETSPEGYFGFPLSPSIYRTDWQGTQLLYPTARTNLLTSSGTLSDANWVAWGAATIAGGILDPTGGSNAYQVDMPANYTGWHHVDTAKSSGPTYTGSIWMRADAPGTVRFFDGNGTSFNSVVSVTTSWQKFSSSGVSTSVAAVQLGVYRDSSTTLGRVYIYAPQLEQATYATSYIPTTSAAVTVTDYTLSGTGLVTLASAPDVGATIAYDNGSFPPGRVFGIGDGTRTIFQADGLFAPLSTNSGLGNGTYVIDLRGATAFRMVKSGSSETATVTMTLKRDALQYQNNAGTWVVT